MKIKAEDLINEFFLSYRSDFTYEEVHEIILSEWKFLRENLNNDELPPIRLMGFGTFNVQPVAVKKELNDLYKYLLKKRLNSQQYFRRKESLERYLSRLEDPNQIYKRKRRALSLKENNLEPKKSKKTWKAIPKERKKKKKEYYLLEDII